MNALQFSAVYLTTKFRKHAIFIGRTTSNLLSKQNKVGGCEYFLAKKQHNQRERTDPNYPARNLPKFIYIQNPITWIINKLDFRMLKKAWDPEFNEKEFKRGTNQAVSVICNYISDDSWVNLKGLITSQALTRLRRDIDNWTDEQKRLLSIEPEDIKLSLTRKVNFLKVSDQRFVDVDMVFVGMKFKEKEPSMSEDVVFIEMAARFHRNYSDGQIPNWTVSFFKVTRYNVLKQGTRAQKTKD